MAGAPGTGKESLRTQLVAWVLQMCWATTQRPQKYSNNLGIVSVCGGKPKKAHVPVDGWAEHLTFVNSFSRSDDRVRHIIYPFWPSLGPRVCIFSWFFPIITWTNKLTSPICINIRINIWQKKHRPSTMAAGNCQRHQTVKKQIHKSHSDDTLLCVG